MKFKTSILIALIGSVLNLIPGFIELPGRIERLSYKGGFNYFIIPVLELLFSIALIVFFLVFYLNYKPNKNE